MRFDVLDLRQHVQLGHFLELLFIGHLSEDGVTGGFAPRSRAAIQWRTPGISSTRLGMEEASMTAQSLWLQMIINGTFSTSDAGSNATDEFDVRRHHVAGLRSMKKSLRVRFA
jgi:hypothetical protein